MAIVLSGFVEVNPNSKFRLRDHSITPPLRVFESGNILLYLADTRPLYSSDVAGRTETLNWLFWLQGSAPYLGGGFGHFYHYAPEKIEYAINRFTLEAKRQLDVLDRQLADHRSRRRRIYHCRYRNRPWYGNLVLNNQYGGGEFLDAVVQKCGALGKRDCRPSGGDPRA